MELETSKPQNFQTPKLRNSKTSNIMRKIVFIVMLLVLCSCVEAQDEVKKVLFVGNSYTEVNNLPLLVKKVSESAGYRIEYSSNTPGGCTFAQHCENASMDLIRQGGWDVVVLQEQSQLPSFPQNQVERECLPYAARLVDSVYAHNPDGEAMFYMTWGRQFGDQQNAVDFPVLGSYEGMDSMLYERYMYMARNNDASVCPVGRVWRYLRENRNDIMLYQRDESHPSLAGSYAAACSFYTMIFHRSPLEITYSADLNESEALAIREAVQRVVYDTLSFWLRQSAIDTTQTDTTQTDTTQADTTEVGIIQWGQKAFQLYPNPATTQVSVWFPDGVQKGDVSLFDLKGCRLRMTALDGESAKLSLVGLPKGIYLLSVTTESGCTTKRLVVQ